MRFGDESFSNNTRSTIGVDYKARAVTMRNGEVVKLQIWDTAGQERFRAMTKSFFARSKAIILTFDVSNLESFEALHGTEGWLSSIRSSVADDTAIVLCANKADLPETSWAVKRVVIKEFADENSLRVHEVSALSGQGVKEMFLDVAEMILANLKSAKSASSRETVSVNDSVRITFSDQLNAVPKKGCSC